MTMRQYSVRHGSAGAPRQNVELQVLNRGGKRRGLRLGRVLRPLLRLPLAAGLAVLSACQAEQQFSTKYACSFVYYASYHPNSALTLALGNAGHYCIVAPKVVGGVTHLAMTPNIGSWTTEQTDVAMVTAIENERLSYDNMGANRRLIVGLSNFNGLKAFDGQCPYCLDKGSSPNRPLAWTDKGQMLECANCKTKYNPNADGVPVNGNEETPRLIEYRADYNGERLYVHN